jgi:ribosome-associated protein
MENVFIRQGEDFIRLGQAMKKAGLVGSGVDAKFLIQDGLVQVNGEVETRRGRKLVDGDTFSYENETYQVKFE